MNCKTYEKYTDQNKTTRMKSLLLVLILLSFSVSYSQEQENIVGNWSSCYEIGSKKIPTCDSTYIYEFEENNRYTHVQKLKNNTYTQTGKWEYNKKGLTIDMDDTTNATYFPYTNKVKWVNEDLFYTIGREGFLGPKVYHYYYRIK